MKEFKVKITFYTTPNVIKTVETTDNVTALIHVLNGLSLDEKDNVVSVKVVA